MGIVCVVAEELDPRVYDSEEQKHIWTVWQQFQDPTTASGLQLPSFLPPTLRFGSAANPPIVFPHGLHLPNVSGDQFVRTILKTVDIDSNGGFPRGSNAVAPSDNLGDTMMVPEFSRDDKVRGLVVEEVYLVTRVGDEPKPDKGKGTWDRASRNYGSYLGHSRLSSATPNTPGSSLPKSSISARACFLGTRSDWVLEVKHKVQPRSSPFSFLANVSTNPAPVDDEEFFQRSIEGNSAGVLPPTPADSSRDTVLVRFLALECTYGYLCGGVRSPERVGTAIVSQMRAAAASDDLLERMINTERASNREVSEVSYKAAIRGRASFVLSMIGATLVKPLSYGGAAWLDIEEEEPASVLDGVGTWLGDVFGGVASRKQKFNGANGSWW
ncbi:hypothetical protein HDU93_003223 [Gonapodya sp. JEL0774]|nr:hypothetical protein HDU93_003223 [Gonapodya sp. JEL0774]